MKILKLWVFMAAAWMCVAAPAYGQQTETPPAPEQIETESPALQSEAPLQNALDAEQEALTQLNKAEREFLEAARLRAAAQGQTPDANTPSDPVASPAELAAANTAAQTDVAPGLFTSEGLKTRGQAILNKLIEWFTNPAFLAQLGTIIFAFFASPIIANLLKKKIFLFRSPPEETAKLKPIRDYIYRSGKFLRIIILVILLAIIAAILKAIPIGAPACAADAADCVATGQNWLVKLAQGLAVVFLLYKAIKEFITNPLFQKVALWTIIPLALLVVFGYFDDLTNFMNSVELLRMGKSPITLMTVVQVAIFGALFFKLGGIANKKGQDAIRSQDSLDSSTREVVSKIFQILVFGLVFILVMGAAKVPLSGLVVIFSALSLGIGLGLQPVAANFVSGLIILFDRSVRVGDFVSLEDGREGFVEAINMRSTTVETTDGKDIMVPNTTFIESSYENWTHKDPRQRYEVYFTVAYDTDIDTLEDIIMPAIKAHPSVLMEPEEPDLELREFGENGINFAVEFWCSGIDDGPNKFTSDLNFAIWRVLKKNGIVMPLPQRIIKTVK